MMRALVRGMIAFTFITSLALLVLTGEKAGEVSGLQIAIVLALSFDRGCCEALMAAYGRHRWSSSRMRRLALLPFGGALGLLLLLFFYAGRYDEEEP